MPRSLTFATILALFRGLSAAHNSGQQRFAAKRAAGFRTAGRDEEAEESLD